MRIKQPKMLRLLAPVILVTTATVTGAATISLVAVAHGTAKVGDIIAFEPSSDPSDEPEARLAVHRAGQFGCVLDLNTIRRSGGSLVVEMRLEDGGSRFQLHWAGARTTNDGGDCGRSADLILDRSDLDSLALAAGGYGVGRKRPPAFTSALAN